MCKICSPNTIFKNYTNEKGERHQLKERFLHMEIVLNLCANKGAAHEDHVGKSWCAHGKALWWKNHKSGYRKKIMGQKWNMM
jgi:hypothetical protein